MTAPVLQYPLELAGVVTRVLECGTGDAAIVCLHGSGSRADRWRPALPLLADAGFHVYAVDFPGHGLAEKPIGYPYGAPAFTDVAVALVDHLDQPAVSILGTSLGGHVGARTACERPERVRSTVLIGAVGLVPWEREAGSPIVDTSLAGIRSKLRFLVADGALVTDAWVREEAQVNSSPGGPAALAELGRWSVEDADGDLVGERYAELGLPTMLVWGAQDRWVDVHVGTAAAALLPDAPFLLLGGTGHAPYFERPAHFVAEVAPFLRDPSSVPAGRRTA